MSRRGTAPNPLPLGSSFSPFSQLSSQSPTAHPLAQSQSKAKASPSTRPSTLSRTVSGSGGGPTVEEWESKAPLDEYQIRCIAAVKRGSEYVRIPDKFVNSNDKDSPSRPSTPVARNKLISSSVAPGTPASGISRPGTPSRLGPTNHKLHPKHPLHTPQAFYDWHALISRSVTHAQESHFHAHLDSVSSHIAACDFLISQIDLVDQQVDSMYSEWQGVEEGGRSLKESSEGLLEERDALLRVENELGERLEYFMELEYATRMLNAPVLEASKGKGGRPLVLEAEFLDMVERVVVCIQWLELHRHYREAEMYFVGSLRAVQADVGRRLSDKSVSSSAQTTHHLLYTRFRALISPPAAASSPMSTPSSLRPLLFELESRVRLYPSELGALLGECHAAYLAARKALVGPVVREEVGGLVRGIDLASGGGTSGDIVELTRAGCSYLKQICTEEFELFKEFFTSGEEELYTFLETLCDYLYDDLRPRILHEPRLTALCEVCTVLQALMVLDVDVGDDGDSDSPGDDVDEDLGELELDLNLDPTLRPRPRHTLSSSASAKTSNSRLHIAHLLQMILQDAQTRLFFKAQAVVQSDIRHYVAKGGDLSYPSKLLNAAGLLDAVPSSSRSVNEKESFSQLWSRQLSDSGGVSLDNQDTWYPTLRKTVWVLEQLHDYVNPAIFEDIAEEAFVLCHASLVAASDAIINSNSSTSLSSTTPPSESTSTDGASPPTSDISRSTPLDGYLFLVRHLLVLREVPARFGLGNQSMEGVTPAAGANGRSEWASFTGNDKKSSVGVTNSMSDTLSSLLGGTPAVSLLASFGMMSPELGGSSTTGNADGKRTVDNAKQTINQSLRRSCEMVITACANDMCEPVRKWVERVGAFSAAAASAASRGASLPPSTSASSLATSSSTQSILSKDEKAQVIPEWATPASARSIDTAFREACQGRLTVIAQKIRLYLGGIDRVEKEPIPQENDSSEKISDSASPTNTAARALCSVFLYHVQERIGEEYAWFRDVLWGLSSDSATGTSASSLYSQTQLDELRELRSTVLDDGALKVFLKGILESP